MWELRFSLLSTNIDWKHYYMQKINSELVSYFIPQDKEADNETVIVALRNN